MAKLVDYVSVEEFEKLYRTTKDKSFRLAMLLSFGSGLRISEILGLRIHYTRCCKVKAIKERAVLNGKKKMIFKCPVCYKFSLSFAELYRNKDGEWEYEPLTPDKVNLKTHQIRILGKGGKERITITPPNLTEEMISLLPFKMSRSWFQNKFYRHTQEILGKRKSVHSLRHGFGNFQANVLGTPLPIVQTLMGHSRIDTTGIYTRANPQQAISDVWKRMTGESS